MEIMLLRVCDIFKVFVDLEIWKITFDEDNFCIIYLTRVIALLVCNLFQYRLTEQVKLTILFRIKFQ